MPKPFSLQAPEEVAKEYGGNKQKIMSAAQTGIVDPTAAVLAGMFIDRMRNAAQAEQGGLPTIAQQVLSPQPQGGPPPGGPPPGGPPPGGLGGMPPPDMGGAPGGPPPGMDAGAPPPDDGSGAPPPGMADGGRVKDEDDDRARIAEQIIASLRDGGEQEYPGEGPSIHGNAQLHGGSNYNLDVPAGEGGLSLEASSEDGLIPKELAIALRQRLGGNDLSARHRLKGGTDYRLERDLGPGRVGVGASASHGVKPDRVSADYRMEFAEGGLAQIGIPDEMYSGDEPGYEAGGLVSFGTGGMTGEDFLAYLKSKESGTRGDYNKDGTPLRNKRSGAMYSMQVLPSTAHNPGYGVKPAADDSPEEYNRVGRELGLVWQKKFGDAGGAAAYNMGPGAYAAHLAGRRRMPDETKNYIAGIGGTTGHAGGISAKTGAERGEYHDDITRVIPEGRSFSDTLDEMGEAIGPRAHAARDAELAATDFDPEAAKKERSSELWGAFSRMMFKAATSNQGLIGGAAAAAPEELDSLAKSSKERKAERIAGLHARTAAEDQDYTDRLGLGKVAAEMMSDQEKTRQGALNRRAEVEANQAKLQSAVEEGRLTRENAIKVAQIGNYTQQTELIELLLSPDPAKQAVGERLLTARASAKEPKATLESVVNKEEGTGSQYTIREKK